MAEYCPSCGGLIGRDCFNTRECAEITRAMLADATPQDIGEVSDGYHTFNELYEHRHALFIALCRILDGYDHELRIWRARTHADGTMFDGWFIMGIGEMPGDQITFHLPQRFWDETWFASELPHAPEFDGHTSENVIARLRELRP